MNSPNGYHTFLLLNIGSGNLELHQENIHDLITFIIFLAVCFIRGHNLDPDDSEVLFHLALNQALMRQVG